MDEIKKILEKKQIPHSIHRIKILQYLMSHENAHPSVEELYLTLLKELPTLSKSTVYNTLSLFKDHGLLSVVLDEQEAKYDINMQWHGHFKCEHCGEIYDIPASEILYDQKSLKDFEIKEKHLLLKGVCKSCKK